MRKTASKRVTVPHQAGHDAAESLIKELQSLFERVQAASCAINTAIALERAAGSADSDTDVILLDDLTPRYLRANSARGSLRRPSWLCVAVP
jgi:hypothetical protein